MSDRKPNRRTAIKESALLLGALVASAKAQGSGDTSPSPKPSPTPSPVNATASAATRDIIKELGGLKKEPPPFLRENIPAAATSGFPRDDATWKSIVDKLTSMFPHGETQLSTQALPRIEKDFEFHSEENDKNFRFQQVEVLLDQAADLLDRGIKTRREWNDLSARALYLFLELKEYVEIDKIHQDEIAAGFYTLAYEMSSSSMAAEQATKFGEGEAATYIASLLDSEYSLDVKNAQSGNIQLEAWLSHLAVYEKPEVGSLLPITWNGVTKNAPEHLQNGAFSTSFHNLNTESTTLLAQKQAHASASQSSERRSNGLSAKMKWDLADINFRRRRTQVARELADLKTKAFTEEGGAFNFLEQMQPMKAIFRRDFRDALARMIPAATGLKIIFGYENPLPAPGSSTYFDDCLIWIRDAIAFTIRFSHNDQSYALAVSIKQLITDEEWKQGRETGTFEFSIDEGYAGDFFSGQRHVRLQGVSGFAVGDVHEGIFQYHAGVWRFTIYPPRSSFYRQLSGRHVVADQSHIEPARLARVATRALTKDADVAGASAFRNISPFGKWKLVVSKLSTSGTPLRDMQDLQLDLIIKSRTIV